MELCQPVVEQLRVTPRQHAALAKLGIRMLRDLLFHFPSRYESAGSARRISELRPGDRAVVVAEVVGVKAEKTWRKKMRIAEGLVRDETGVLSVIWFNQPYVAHVLKPQSRVRLAGKITKPKDVLVMANPSFEALGPDDVGIARGEGILPIYPETYGITSRWFRYQIQRLLPAASALPDPLPADILSRYRLPALDRALRAIHQPKTLGEAEAARKRFAFEEVFIIQLDRQRERARLASEPAFRIEADHDLLNRFAASLPFPLTGAQRSAIGEIVADFREPHPMARLLEGDVGSGKTLVAAAGALCAAAAGHQAVYMAPTEILARQHFEEFMRRLAPFRIRLGLLTGSGAEKFPSKVTPSKATPVSRAQLLAWVKNGDIQILIGTHAVIERRVAFKRLAFTVVDEQHRFGVSQRRRALKGVRPHFLSMSATPIPRTLALTIYGDLDLSVLDEMPPGREPIVTRIIPPHERESTYEFVRAEIRSGGQAFVICPKIEDKQPDPGGKSSGTPQSPAKLDWAEVKSVKAEFKRLSEEIFTDFRIGMVHGRLKPDEKDAVMRAFKARDLDILVSTSVIEVGVDVPNASIMMIEGGERFGLAQLHQFRGRVGRGSRKSYCLVFTTDGGSTKRLEALTSAKTGFELAEYDLAFRGPGELSGNKQWGVSDVGMEALKNVKMIEAARREAETLIAGDPDLRNHPHLAERVRALSRDGHFE